MMPGISNIDIKGFKKGKPKLKADGLVVPFYQTKKTLKMLEDKNDFIKKTEKVVRDSARYKRYKQYLMKDIGLNFCSIFPKLNTDIKKIKIEMHHGPILTLYDYCFIITDYLLETYGKCTSLHVADIVLTEHEENNIQVIMLNDTAHKLLHTDRQCYVSPKQAWGNLNNFLEKYEDYIDPRFKHIINKNLEIAKKQKSTFNDKFDLNEFMERWDNK